MKIYGDRPTIFCLLLMAGGMVLHGLTGDDAFLKVMVFGMLAGVICTIRLTLKKPAPSKDPFVIWGSLAFMVLMSVGIYILPDRKVGAEAAPSTPSHSE